MWQALNDELAGVTVVTVALDTGGVEAAGPWIDAASPAHPSLIDEAHVTAGLLGFVNVPSAVWIDEEGLLVRPAHAAHIRPSRLREMEVPEGLGRIGEMLHEIKRFRVDPTGYRAAVTDWATLGADSRFALSPEEVINQSKPRPRDHATAAAAFELGQHLWREGRQDRAAEWFRQAHQLHPENWTYKRQAWTFATTKPGQPSDLIQGPNDVYEGNWLDDVRALGAETYYEPFDG